MSFGYRAKFNVESAVKDPLTAEEPTEEAPAEEPQAPSEAPKTYEESRALLDRSLANIPPYEVPGGDQ